MGIWWSDNGLCVEEHKKRQKNKLQKKKKKNTKKDRDQYDLQFQI